MNGVVCVFIWDRGADVLTRSIEVTSKSKPIKVNGRKANKVIIPSTKNNKKLIEILRKICSYNVKIIVANNR